MLSYLAEGAAWLPGDGDTVSGWRRRAAWCSNSATIGAEKARRRPGWLLRAGRLDIVQVHARTGRRLGTVGRVVALDLAIPPETGTTPYRLTAAMAGTPIHYDVLTGRDRDPVEKLAVWLADRADVPVRLTPPTEPATRGPGLAGS